MRIGISLFAFVLLSGCSGLPSSTGVNGSPSASLIVPAEVGIESLRSACAGGNVFYGKIRSGDSLRFGNSVINSTGSRAYIDKDSLRVEYAHDGVLGSGQKLPAVAWHGDVLRTGFVLQPGENVDLYYTVEKTTFYRPKRRSQENFAIRYSWVIDGGRYVDCKFYEVTWCGDGEVDSANGEECDAGASTEQCSAECKKL